MATFPVSPVEISGRRIRDTTLADSFKERTSRPVEAGASNLEHLVAGPSHPFLQAVHFAFDDHLPLVLSPDDVWLCLAQGFGTHVNLNAEALRARFVTHEGQAVIRVERDGFVKGSPANDWRGVFTEISDRLADHLGKKRDLVVADFSTTGAVEKAASQIVLMSAMQQYFDYRVLTRCGIPHITLLGTVEDWRSVRRRAEVLAEFGLESWVRSLNPILDHFVAAAGGSADPVFWRSLYKHNDNSGGPYVTGWINVLFPYIEEAKRSAGHFEETGACDPAPNPYVESWADNDTFGGGPTLASFPVGLARAPFIWEYLGTNIPMELLGGFVGVSQDPETLAVRPAIGWAVREAANEG